MEHVNEKWDNNWNKIGKAQKKKKPLFILIFTFPSGEDSTKLEREEDNSIIKKKSNHSLTGRISSEKLFYNVSFYDVPLFNLSGYWK